MATVGDSDRAFGEALRLRGLATAEEVDRCLARIEEMRHLGTAPVPSLLELMAEQGVMDPSANPPSPPAGPSGDPLTTDTGRYKFEALLGRGGMGEVYKAWDKQLRRAVAVKFVHGQGLDDERRLVREAQLAARLNHPNIAPVYEIGSWQGRSFIAMQLVEGVTIDRAKLDLRGMLGAMRDAALALDYAHREGVIHRDLKPENLIVEKSEGGVRVVVLDFGLARPISGGEKLSLSRSILGTPAYMSPEQARGAELDARADVYSLGATLYELLTGRPPFEGADILEIIRKVGNDEPLRPRKLDSQIHRDLETIVLKCLEKDRNRRYASAQELADDLGRFLNHDPIRARPASTIYRLRLRLAKRKAAVLSVVASAVLAGVLGWWLLIGRPHGEHLRLREAAVKLWAEARGAEMAGVGPEGISRRARAAREAFERAIQAREEPQAHVMRARCLQLEGQDEESLKALERAHELDPGNAEARIELAKALLSKYQISRGVPSDYTVINQVSADVTLGIRGLPPETEDQRRWRERGEKLLAAGGAAPEQQALMNGLLAMGKGEHARAAEALALYAKSEPWDSQAHWLEGMCRYYAREFPGASASFDRALGRVPSAAVFRWRGVAKDAGGRYDEAIADYTKAMEIDPTLASACNNRGLSKSSKGLHDEAIADYTKAFELNPKFAVALNNRGNARAFKGRLEEAIADYTKAIGVDPKYAHAYNNRGNAKLSKGLVDEAIADFTKAVELDPKLGDAWYNRGRANSAKGLRDEAIADCTKAIELDPGNAEAWTNRGLAKSQKGLKDDAIADFTKALEIDPKLPEAWTNRGFAKLHKGLAAEAAADWQKALEVAPSTWPSRAEIRDRLANIEVSLQMQEALKLHESKRYAESIEAFRKIVDAYPKSRPAMLSSYNIACGYALLGEKSNALDWLEKAVEMGWKDAAHLERDSDMDSLRAEERYLKLVEALKEK